MLTPANYFDYDVTMESKNAILIHPAKEQGVYEFEDNGVEENFHCLPDAPSAFEYSEMTRSLVMGADGNVNIDRVSEIMQAQEMLVRLSRKVV